MQPKCRRRIETFPYVQWKEHNIDEVVRVATDAGWEPEAFVRKGRVILSLTFFGNRTLFHIGDGDYVVFDPMDGPRYFTGSAFIQHFTEEE
jgi:hypothetical protein